MTIHICCLLAMLLADPTPEMPMTRGDELRLPEGASVPATDAEAKRLEEWLDKDKAEFDQFMADRRNRPATDAGSGATDQPQS